VVRGQLRVPTSLTVKDTGTRLRFYCGTSASCRPVELGALSILAMAFEPGRNLSLFTNVPVSHLEKGDIVRHLRHLRHGLSRKEWKNDEPRTSRTATDTNSGERPVASCGRPASQESTPGPVCVLLVRLRVLAFLAMAARRRLGQVGTRGSATIIHSPILMLRDRVARCDTVRQRPLPPRDLTDTVKSRTSGLEWDLTESKSP
jgi:hypothetical protein